MHGDSIPCFYVQIPYLYSCSPSNEMGLYKLEIHLAVVHYIMCMRAGCVHALSPSKARGLAKDICESVWTWTLSPSLLATGFPFLDSSFFFLTTLFWVIKIRLSCDEISVCAKPISLFQQIVSVCQHSIFVIWGCQGVHDWNPWLPELVYIVYRINLNTISETVLSLDNTQL